jgi:hypothetical protein
VRFKELSSPEFPVADSEANKIMHISLQIGPNFLMGNDVPAHMGKTNENENRSKIAISAESRAEAVELVHVDEQQRAMSLVVLIAMTLLWVVLSEPAGAESSLSALKKVERGAAWPHVLIALFMLLLGLLDGIRASRQRKVFLGEGQPASLVREIRHGASGWSREAAALLRALDHGARGAGDGRVKERGRGLMSRIVLIGVGILTDYIIQIPAITADEKLIQPGQKVMVSTSATEYGRQAELSSINGLMGRLMPWDGSASTERFCIGRCFNKIAFADGSASAGTKLSADTTYTLTSAGRAEFKGLDKVQTVPGLGLAGSGTKGVPGWLTDARADSSGTFYLLNILVRIS